MINQNKASIAYGDAIQRLLTRYAANGVRDFSDMPMDAKKKLAIYYVKFLPSVILHRNATTPDPEKAEEDFFIVCLAHDLLGVFTPREMMHTFPIDKRYDGGEDWKDYYYTRNYLQKLNMDKPIGKEAVSKFLCEYMNDDLDRFNLTIMTAMSDVQKARGQKDWFKQFTEDQGWNLKFYEHFSDGSGDYIQDVDTGKLIKVEPHKRRPKWIRRVK